MVWSALAALVLIAVSLGAAVLGGYTDYVIAFGLAGVVSAVLSLREDR